MPVDAPPLNLHLAPDECLLAMRAGDYWCVRADHAHDAPSITATEMDHQLAAIQSAPASTEDGTCQPSTT